MPGGSTGIGSTSSVTYLAKRASLWSTALSISVNTGAISKVAPDVFNADPSQSPATEIGSGPAKF
jgi:hypothetical protein